MRHDLVTAWMALSMACNSFHTSILGTQDFSPERLTLRHGSVTVWMALSMACISFFTQAHQAYSQTRRPYARVTHIEAWLGDSVEGACMQIVEIKWPCEKHEKDWGQEM